MEAIGTLAGGIAHDFNNILSAIMGYTELAEVHALEGTELRKHLLQVLKATRRAKDLVSHILAFSRHGDAQEIRPVAVAPIIKEALKLMRASLPSTVQIRKNISSEAGAIMGDPTQIHQVLMNLCTNAAHAMREQGGTLDVRLNTMELDTRMARTYAELKEGVYVRLTVKDTGHGMNPASLERIFDPYFTTKGVGEGTGLGLAVVHGIVKSHGGAIAIQSEPGKGTVFEILFPRIDFGQEKSTNAQGPVPKGTERILFVDDENALAELGQMILSPLGYEVTTTMSSLEALELFRSQPAAFDLVVTDMTMPKMTGVGLASEMLRIRPDLPIILCTGHSDEITEDRAKDIGIRAFVMKPLSRRNLAEVIRKILDEE
jgi:CheY-like chemotaxis protein